MRALPALSMSLWICWAFVAVDTWNCCTRFAVFVSVAVSIFVSISISSSWSLSLSSLTSRRCCSSFFLSLLCVPPATPVALPPSLSLPLPPLSLFYLCSSSSSLCRWHLDLGASAAIYQENSWAHKQRQLVFIFIPILRLHSLPEVHCLAPRTLCCCMEWCSMESSD